MRMNELGQPIGMLCRFSAGDSAHLSESKASVCYYRAFVQGQSHGADLYEAGPVILLRICGLISSKIPPKIRQNGHRSCDQMLAAQDRFTMIVDKEHGGPRNFLP